MTVDQVVSATVQIRYGDEPVGSGFRFLDENIVITSAHILGPREDIPITAISESGTAVDLDPRKVSPPPEADGHDFAVLEATDSFPDSTAVLQPASERPSRGDAVWFAGHPFHLSETLVHTAIVSGSHPHGFHLDGSVNHGNSGGPIVSRDAGEVVGIVTESQIYRDQDLDEAIDSLRGIQGQLLRIQEVHETTINGIDVEDFAIDSVQELEDVISILSTNISSGIGVGYDIQPVVDGIEDVSFD